MPMVLAIACPLENAMIFAPKFTGYAVVDEDCLAVYGVGDTEKSALLYAQKWAGVIFPRPTPKATPLAGPVVRPCTSRFINKFKAELTPSPETYKVNFMRLRKVNGGLVTIEEWKEAAGLD